MWEKYVKVSAVSKEVSKGKGKGKSSSESTKRDTSKGRMKVTVTKIPPKIVPLPFLAEPPAEGTRGAKKRKKRRRMATRETKSNSLRTEKNE